MGLRLERTEVRFKGGVRYGYFWKKEFTLYKNINKLNNKKNFIKNNFLLNNNNRRERERAGRGEGRGAGGGQGRGTQGRGRVYIYIYIYMYETIIKNICANSNVA